MSTIEHLQSELRIQTSFLRKYPSSHLSELSFLPGTSRKDSWITETLTDQTTAATNFQQALNAVHSGAINTFIGSLSVNGVQPPPIREEELKLPRVKPEWRLRNFILETVVG